MPNDASSLQPEHLGGTYVTTERYPADAFGYREVPIIHKDAFGRVSRVEMKRLSPDQFRKWLRETSS